MYDFTAITKIKESKKETLDNHSEKFDLLISKALASLEEFASSPCFDYDNLADALNYLLEAIEIKRSKVQPYFYLAYIFYMFNDLTRAVNYLLVATSIDPNFEGLKKLRENINQKISENIKEDILDVVKEVEKEKNDFSLDEEKAKKIGALINNYRQNEVKYYSNSFRDKITKLWSN